MLIPIVIPRAIPKLLGVPAFKIAKSLKIIPKIIGHIINDFTMIDIIIPSFVNIKLFYTQEAWNHGHRPKSFKIGLFVFLNSFFTSSFFTASVAYFKGLYLVLDRTSSGDEFSVENLEVLNNYKALKNTKFVCIK